jgi:hypothetical protein
MKRLYRLTPHQRLSRNPLFALETRRIRWGHSAKAITDYSAVLVGVVCAVVALVWLLIRLSERYPSRVSDFSILLVALSLIASLLLDYRCLSTALGSINGEAAAGRWDLLRLTALDYRQIVVAKYGVAQVRVWRLMTLITALRLGIVLTLGLNTLIIMLQDSAGVTRTSGEIISTLFAQLVLVVVAVIYVIEPFWRMRMVTALGMAISARARQHASSVLVGIGALAALWLSQGIIVTAIAFGVSVFIMPLALVEYSVNGLIFCSPAIFLIALIAAFYGFYSVVQAWSQRYAERWAARIN